MRAPLFQSSKTDIEARQKTHPNTDASHLAARAAYVRYDVGAFTLVIFCAVVLREVRPAHPRVTLPARVRLAPPIPTAQDALARTSQAVQAVRAMQAAARNAALQWPK